MKMAVWGKLILTYNAFCIQMGNLLTLKHPHTICKIMLHAFFDRNADVST